MKMHRDGLHSVLFLTTRSIGVFFFVQVVQNNKIIYDYLTRCVKNSILFLANEFIVKPKVASDEFFLRSITLNLAFNVLRSLTRIRRRREYPMVKNNHLGESSVWRRIR